MQYNMIKFNFIERISSSFKLRIHYFIIHFIFIEWLSSRNNAFVVVEYVCTFNQRIGHGSWRRI
jgi:hypothetical protein